MPDVQCSRLTRIEYDYRSDDPLCSLFSGHGVTVLDDDGCLFVGTLCPLGPGLVGYDVCTFNKQVTVTEHVLRDGDTILHDPILCIDYLFLPSHR